MFNFEKLEVYNKALLFSKEIYKETIDWSSKYQFNLCEQLRRASLSISLNIAEGSAKSKADFGRFISIARGSCFECVPLIESSYELKLLSAKKKDEWYNSLVSLAQMLSKLKSSLSK